MEKMDIKHLKTKGKQLEPIIRIGKSGITENVIMDLKKHLDKRNLIKIKFLRSYISTIDKAEAFKKITDLTDSVLIDSTGFVIVIAKYRQNLNKKK